MIYSLTQKNLSFFMQGLNSKEGRGGMTPREVLKYSQVETLCSCDEAQQSSSNRSVLGENLPISAGHHPSPWEQEWFRSNKMLPESFCWHVSGPLEYRCVPVETSQIHSDLLPMCWDKTTDTFPSCPEWLLFARNNCET